MTLTVDKEIRKITINVGGATSDEEKEYHVDQDANIVILNLEEINK